MALVQRAAFRALVLALVAAWPAPARGQSTPSMQVPVDLVWTAPPACPAREVLVGELERLLGRPAVVPRARELHVRATATVDAAGAWHVRIETLEGGAVGERVFDAEGCERLVSATALAVAIVIDPTWVPPAPACGGLGEACCAPPAAACAVRSGVACVAGRCRAEVRAPVVPRQQPPPPRAVRPPRLFALVRAEAAIDLTALPAPTPGFGGAVGLAYGRARVELLGHYWLAQRADATGVSGAYGTGWLVAFGARGCGALLEGAVELGLCATGALGYYEAQGFGPTIDGRVARTLWAGAYGGPAFAWNIGRYVALRAVIEAGANVVVPQWRFGGAGSPVTVFQAMIPAGRGALGVEVHFP